MLNPLFPYFADTLWEEKRKSQLGGSGDLRPVPEEGHGVSHAQQHHHTPPSDINNIIPPYTTTFSPSPRADPVSQRRHYNTIGAPGSGPTAHVKPQVVANAAARRGPNMAATRQQQQQQQQQQLLNNRTLPHLGGSKGISSSSPRSSPLGSRDSLNDHSLKQDAAVTHHRADAASLNNCRQGTGNRNSGSTNNKSVSGSKKPEEVIYVNTFGHRMPLHPLGRVEETLDEGGGSDDSGSTTTSGSFEVDQGDRCSANSVQTVINATQMDTVV